MDIPVAIKVVGLIAIFSVAGAIFFKITQGDDDE